MATKDGDLSIPEDLGAAASQKLLEQIYFGGCTDAASQSLAALFMALGPRDVSKVILGPLTDYTIAFLQHLREFFGITFQIHNYISEDDEDVIRGADKINMTCVGIGYSNINKRIT